MAEVLRMDGFSRSAVRIAQNEDRLVGFEKGCLITKLVDACETEAERMTTAANLLAAEMLTAGEVRALAHRYGWEVPA